MPNESKVTRVARTTRRHAARTEDLLPKARIRASALRLFAERGPSATTLREIAQDAGVSLGAVNYHFVSKDQLIEAVHEDVLAQMREAVRGIDPDLTPTQARLARRDAVRRLHQDAPEIASYVQRAVLSGGAEGHDLFRSIYGFARSEMEERVASGISRPMADPELEPAIYLLVSSAQLFIGHYLEDMFGLDFSRPEDQVRLEAAALDLLTRPFFQGGGAEVPIQG
jgi:AcrR family transcriptional regulator